MRPPAVRRTPGRSSLFYHVVCQRFCLGDPESQDVSALKPPSCRWTSWLSFPRMRTPLAVICASPRISLTGVVEEKEQLASTAPSSAPNPPAHRTGESDFAVCFHQRRAGRTRAASLDVSQTSTPFCNTRETAFEQAGLRSSNNSIPTFLRSSATPRRLSSACRTWWATP